MRIYKYLESKLPKDLCNIVNDYLYMKDHKLKKMFILELKSVYEVIKYDLYGCSQYIIPKNWTSADHEYFCNHKRYHNFDKKKNCISNSKIFLIIINYKKVVIKRFYSSIKYYKQCIKNINLYNAKRHNAYLETRTLIKHKNKITEIETLIDFLKIYKVSDHDKFISDYRSFHFH